MDGWILNRELGDNKDEVSLFLSKAEAPELYFGGNVWFKRLPQACRFGLWFALIILEIWDPETWRFINNFGPKLLEYLDD